MISLGLGSVIAQILALPSILGNESLWKFLLLFEILLPIFLLVVSVLFFESPKYLYMVQHDRTAANKSIQQYYGKQFKLEKTLNEFSAEAAAERSEETKNLMEIIKTPFLRRALLISITANIVCMTNGYILRTEYSATLLRRMSIDDSLVGWLAIGIAAIWLLVSSISGLLMDRFKRRNSFLNSLGVSVGLLAVFTGLQCIIQEGVLSESNTAEIWMKICYKN